MTDNFLLEIKRRFPYRIEGFVYPDLSQGNSLGRFGFTAELELSVALEARKFELKDSVRDNFQKIGHKIMECYGLEELGPRDPYMFVDDSLLLHFVTVPGNACDVGLEHHSQGFFCSDRWEIEEGHLPKI